MPSKTSFLRLQSGTLNNKIKWRLSFITQGKVYIMRCHQCQIQVVKHFSEVLEQKNQDSRNNCQTTTRRRQKTSSKQRTKKKCFYILSNDPFVEKHPNSHFRSNPNWTHDLCVYTLQTLQFHFSTQLLQLQKHSDLIDPLNEGLGFKKALRLEAILRFQIEWVIGMH